MWPEMMWVHTIEQPESATILKESLNRMVRKWL